jgi:hypothetical protein
LPVWSGLLQDFGAPGLDRFGIQVVLGLALAVDIRSLSKSTGVA